jgi:hypothetical protein
MDFDAAIGLTQFDRHRDGVWYQRPYPHDLDLRSASLRLGIVVDRWRFGAEYLGTVRSHALAKASDSAYLEGRTYPLSTWHGKGRTYGAYVIRDFTPFYGGAYLYRTTWDMHIPDWRPCVSGPDGPACVADTPRPLSVSGAARWALTPVVGVCFGPLDLSVRHIQTHGDPYPSIARGLAWNLSATTAKRCE